MKTKQGSPSGVGSRIYAATKFKPISLTELGFSQSVLRLLMVLLVLPMAFVNAWAGGGGYNTYLKVEINSTSDTGKGLVYASESNSSPSESSYTNSLTTDGVATESKSTAANHYAWALPARGFEFNKWTFSGASAAYVTNNHGAADVIKTVSNGGNNPATSTTGTATASWTTATPYVVTYKQPEGGEYVVQYNYRTVSNNKFTTTTTKETLNLTPTSGDMKPYGVTQDDHDYGYSYAADEVTLTTSSAGFVGWYEGSSPLGTGTGANHSLVYEINKTTNISALFKWAVLTAPEDKAVQTNSKTDDEPSSVVFDVTTTGTWSSGDFSAAVQDKTGSGSFTIGTIEYDDTEHKVTVNFTYNAENHFGEGTTANIVLTPQYGESASVGVSGLAVEVVDYQARVLVGGEMVNYGTLADMLADANGREDATLQLAQNVVAENILQFKKSMILDLNSFKLSSTSLNNLILIQGDNASDKVNLTITDDCFLKSGEIEAKKSANAAVEAIKVADANKLTLKNIKVTAENTATFASNANAKALGVHIIGTGNVIISKKANAEEPDVRIAAKSDHDARGVFAESGYATFQNVAITADANVDAYAFYSNATSNISDATLTAATATGANAYAAYIAGGTAIMDRVAMTTTSATTAAYGANVAAGRLVMNGGSVSATAASDVYGVCVQSNAEANIQVKTNIEATSITGANAYGVRNFGALTMNNITVTATSAANYATAVETAASADSTIIEDGKYTAYAATGFAHGVLHQHGKLKVDGGSFEAIITTSGSGAFGARILENATIANATLYGESQGSGNKAHGIVAGESGKTITLTNCNITGKSNTAIADAIFSRANVTATGCLLTATTLSADSVMGVYVENGINTITNCNATVTAQTIKAYGVNFKNGTLIIRGGTYDVKAKQATAVAAGDSKAYGVMIPNGKEATLNDVTFLVKGENGSFSQNVYGIYTGSGTINSTNCTCDVSAATKAYGIWGGASSTLNLQNNTINATTKTTTTAYGIYSKGSFTIDGDIVTSETKTHTSYPLFFASGANGNVIGGKFKAKGVSGSATEIVAPINKDASVASVHVKGGFFYDISNLRYYVPDGYDVYGVDPGAVEYSEGYYYRVDDHLPYDNVCYVYIANNGNNTGSGTGFPTLAEAFDYVRNHSGSNYNIMMTQPYKLPAVPVNNYVLPDNATLIVPYKATQNKAMGTQPTRRGVDIEMIAENCLLTFESGVNLDVYGSIEVSAEQFVCPGASTAYVQGPYGRIHLEEGSTVTLNNGARINAWGYITGSGEIRVKNGAIVSENFQLHDMKSAGDIQNSSKFSSSDNTNTYKVFPVTQYYIQSIEAPTKYYYGSKLLAYMGITVSTYKEAIAIGPIKVIGIDDGSEEKNFFNITVDNDAAWVRKSYNPTTDRILWETNSSAELGSMKITIPGYGTMNSLDYILPLTNNMTLHVLSGKLDITQSVKILPDAEIIIEKEATLQINSKDTRNHDVKLYLYDQAQWGNYAGGAATKTIKYSPSWINGICPRKTAKTDMKDAAIYVKGKIDVQGTIYTSAGGAAIYSDDTNAGTIEYNSNVAASSILYESNSNGSVLTSSTMTDSYYHTFTSAKLRNGGISGGTFISTYIDQENHAKSGDTYAYANIDGAGFKWTKLVTIDDCIIADETDSDNPVYYAKPQGYVAITSATEDENHLFHSVAGSRLFINMPTDAGCQWWEVTATATLGVYYCATNGTYYKYNTTSESWEEYTVKVTFYFTDPKDDAADKKKVLTVNYGATPDVSIVSNPSKAEDDAATYQFYGWKSSKTETEYSYTAELETVTEDMYYLPVFTSITKKYTITFNNAKNGANVPVEVFYGEHPTYDPIKDATAQYTYYFQNWEGYAPGAELPVVTGATSYTAIWAQTVNKYTVTWKNGDEVLETDTKQEYGTATAYNGAKPTKEMDNNFVYAFSGWLSSMTGQTYANGSTPTVAGETTYEAQFSTTPRYAITFANYDGTQLQKESVTQGEHPIYNGLTPGRARDLDGYFRFIGWKNSEGTDYAPNATLPVVTGKETYTAQYDYVTELLWITFNNVDGNGGTWKGKFGVGATPFYDPNNDDVADMPTKADGMEDGLMYVYTFSGWDPELQPVSGEAEYTAQFEKEVKKYNITFANLDGNGAQQTIEVAYGTTPVSPVEPAKGDLYCTYEFLEWDNTIVAVTGDATYTAQFSEDCTPRTFPITFDPDNGVDAPIVMNVAYGQTPTPEDPATWQDAANTYTFSGWNPAIHAVDGPAEYTAQYTPTLRTYTIRFVNYDGTTLDTYTLTYGATPSYSGVTPVKPVDVANRKVYTFDGWSSTNGGSKLNVLPAVNGEATYYAHYTEATYVASVIHEGSESYKTSWSNAYTDAQANDIIKLYDNLTFTSAVSIAKNLTIDLNSHTMYRTGSSTNAIYLIQMSTANVTLTIEDSNPVGGGLIHCVNTSRSSYAINVTQAATVTINGGTIKGEKQNTSTNASRIGVGVYLANANAHLNINGGEIIGTSSGGNNYAVSHSSTSNGYTTVTGGKLKAATSIFQNPTTNRVTLHGGYYNKDVSSNCVAPYYDFATTAEERAVVGSDYTHKVAAAYTITFNNWDGSNLATLQKQIVGATPAYSGATPTKEPQSLYTFRAWKAEGDETEYTTSFPAVTGNTTYVAQYDVVEEFEVSSDTPVENDAAVTTTTVHVNGTLEVENSVTLTTTNLILEASEAGSGQIVNAGTIMADNVYYDLRLYTAARHWHAFGVPWAVDVTANPLTEVETGRTLVVGRDYDIIYYNGATRAAQGAGAHCWEYLKHYSEAGQPVEVMTPGKGYMIAFTSAVQTVRFTKASGAPIIFGGTNTVTGGEGKDGGWNAIANPMAYHATLSAGPTVGYVHDGGEIGSDGYTPYDINGTKYIVGKTVYVQAGSNQTIVVNPAGTAGDMTEILAAPKRTKAESVATDKQYLALGDYYTVSLTNANGVGGKVYVLPEEDKTDMYVIGHDLSQFSMSAQKPQVWVNRYDTKLALNTTAPVNGVADFPISLYAPVAGEYTITNDQSPMTNEEEYTVYLTLDGEAIWNLSSSAYALSLSKGTVSNYGIRISAKVPQVATGMDEAVIDAQGDTRKVLIEDKVFIIRGNNVYSVDGQLVK